MKASEDSADPQEVLDQMANLVGHQERRLFFDRRPDLVTRAKVEELCSEVTRATMVDHERAIELAATARFLAEMLADDRCRALAARASANAFHFARENEQAQRYYQVALDLFLELDDQTAAAVTRSSSLHNLAYLGHYEEVYAWEAKAREVFKRQDDRLRLAILDHNLAIILGRQDKWQEALVLYRRAHKEFLSLERARDAAICLRNVAVCHTYLHNFRESLETYEESRAFCERQGLSRLVMEVNYNIGNLHYLRGEYTQAIRLYRQARQQAKELSDDYHGAMCDLGLTETYLELNLTEEAVELARSAFRAFERQKLPLETAKALTNRAIAVSHRGQPDLALRLLDQARKIFVREENRLWPALIDFYCAVVLTREGRNEEAMALARQSLLTFARSAAESRAVMCELLIARLQLELRDVDEARASVRAAIRRLDGQELPALEHRAFRVLGEIEEAAGAPDVALGAFEKSHRWLEEMRSQLHGDDLKIAFFKDKQYVYESLVWLTMEPVLDSAPPDERRADSEARAFQYIEKSKSRSLADLMAFRAHTLTPRDEDRGEVAERVRHLRQELNWFYRQIDLQQMSGSESVRSEVRLLRRSARDKEEELLRAQRELQTADRELSSIQSAAVVDLETVRDSLPENGTLVEYFIARETIFVAVVDRTSLELRPLASAQETRELHRLLQFQLSRSARLAETASRLDRDVADLAARATRSHLRALHRLLVEPVEEKIAGRQLVIAPHGFLHYVPFQALVDSAGRSLGELVPISYTPSASVYHLCATKESRHEGRSLVLGVADQRAPHIRDEAEAVADTLPSSRLLLGDEASEEALRSQGHGCRYLHIATHGLFRRDNPMFSAIQLGESRLALFDLYSLHLDAELVVLSGCGTGLNAVLGADELLGLTRGLLYAGAQSLLVTLWDVNDASTAVFMRRFYRHLTAGTGRAEALRRTQVEHRRDYPEPYYWAPFVLVGKP